MLRRLALVASCVAGTAVPWAAAGPACASAGHAALVVDTGGDVLEYCVRLPEPEVTGIELIELAHDQHGLEYHLGFGGEAVCMLAGVGPTGDDCWEDHPYFWGYWHGGPEGWTWASTGAGATTVEPGEVEGWSWGTGGDGSSHPAPPPTELRDVCPVAERARAVPAPSPAAPVRASPPVAASPEVPAPRVAGPARRPRPVRAPRARPPRTTPAPEVASSPVAAPVVADEPGSAAPAGAVVVSALLVAAGAVVTRRRKRRA